MRGHTMRSLCRYAIVTLNTKRLFGFWFIALIAVAIVFSSVAYTQQFSKPAHYIPEELRATDPQIRQLLDDARLAADDGDYQTTSAKAEQSLLLAKQSGSIGDRALAETAVAQAKAASGNLADAKTLYQAALDDAVDSSNTVLESELLTTLAIYLQIQGDLDGALALSTKALTTARRSGNVFAVSGALGSLARL